ncbi:MAG TPA: sigma 54-interacting transcriptional regulator [Bacillales bacterium]|nr:sigma 54-interacting transcriptional regulator [Bacillales bacterium]
MISHGSILVIGYRQNTIKAIVEQLQEIRLHDYFEIEARTVDELFNSTIHNDTLVLVTSPIVLTMAKPYLSKHTPYIVAQRTVNYARIREILELPDDMKVLLVSNMKEAAEETIVILKEIGIDLDFESFYPGARYDPSIKVAITPGEAELVPPSIDNVIDIGSRFIDISSIIEIFMHFEMPEFSFNKLSARYIQSLIHVTSELNREIFTTKMLRNSFEQIVNNVDDGVLLFTKEGTINAMNEKAMEILNLQGQNALGKPVDKVIAQSFIKAFQSIQDEYDLFKDIDRVTYYIRKKDIFVDNQFFGTLLLFRKADEIQQIEYHYRNKTKRKNFVAKYTFDDMMTRNRTILESIRIAKQLAKSDSTILLLGETGTGKEILSQAIHNASPRAYYPFVGINFAAFSETLLESELFGYESGAFTGARKEGRSGLFEQAHKGTIFLDEIGDASPAIQNRLLRVLQEKQIMRVGGDQVISLDLRVIAATNKNLEEMMEQGKFREDLFYRLNVLPIHFPSLRERPEDITLLSDVFIHEFSKKLNRPPFRLSEAALKEMKAYHWPGNIRELQNTIEYLAHISGDIAYKEQLPFLSKNRMFHVMKEKDNAFQELLAFFEKKGFARELIAILTFLSNSQHPSGRQKILNGTDLDLSEQQLRYRQKMLRNTELVEVNRGRKGTRITEKGKEFLDFYAKNHQ